jgi:cbb3-type cytochrome oxidase cytochrome c subunit
MGMDSGHQAIEKNVGWMVLLVILVVSVGGLVQIVPLFFQRSTTEPVAGLWIFRVGMGNRAARGCVGVSR